ncbi:MAG: hypothetical protein QW478_05185 [Candidatus Micrarchaeaceae archaeon]
MEEKKEMTIFDKDTNYTKLLNESIDLLTQAVKSNKEREELIKKTLNNLQELKNNLDEFSEEYE